MKKINLDKAKIIRTLEKIFESKVEETKEKLRIEDKKSNDIIYITKKEIKYLVKELNNHYQDNHKLTLLNDFYFEKPIALLNEKEWSEFKIHFNKRKIFKIEKENLSTEISLPSFKYLMFYLINHSLKIKMRHYYHFYQYLNQKSIFERLIEENLGKKFKTEKSLFEFVSRYINFFTLKIYSNQKLDFNDFSNIYELLLFDINLKLKIPVISPEEAQKRVKIIMRGKKGKLEFLENKYKEELMYYYISAIQTAEPEWVYLSYYHIIEHFFPNSNTTDKKKFKSVLEKFINLDELKKHFLESYNEEKWEYYFKERVKFIKNYPTILNEKDFIITLRDRIYSVRNAIVHSKEVYPDRYNPFKDAETLSKEIPLIQSIAELIILKTAEKIKT